MKGSSVQVRSSASTALRPSRGRAAHGARHHAVAVELEPGAVGEVRGHRAAEVKAEERVDLPPRPVGDRPTLLDPRLRAPFTLEATDARFAGGAGDGFAEVVPGQVTDQERDALA